MERLAASAAYFDIPFNRDATQQALMAHVVGSAEPHLRVRLELSPNGNIGIQSTPLSTDALNQIVRFIIADEPIHSDTVHLYHKTTARMFLDEPLKHAKKNTGCDEVLFVNERGALTQGSYMNLFLEQADGSYVTPPISDGVLPGTFRAEFMAANNVIEKSVFLYDLKAAKQVYLGNSVRGLLKTQLLS
jgi:para-aminobenzoate synthetase/4-amino-4-deoxychorismate lyase